MMTITRLAIITGLCVAMLSANAGTLKKDGWDASDCGNKPLAPELDFETIEAFNESVVAINAWQQQAVAYLQCVGKEADADIKRIADSVAARQKEHKELVDNISAQATAFKEEAEVNRPQPEQ